VVDSSSWRPCSCRKLRCRFSDTCRDDRTSVGGLSSAKPGLVTRLSDFLQERRKSRQAKLVRS
jgi:hypothetical protein